MGCGGSKDGTTSQKPPKKGGAGASQNAEPQEPRLAVIFGATGMQGGGIVRALHGDSDNFKVRAVTRDASNEKAQLMASKGNLFNFVSLNV